MQKLGTGRAAFYTLVDIIVKEVVFEEDFHELLDQIESLLGS